MAGGVQPCYLKRTSARDLGRARAGE